MNGAWTDYKIMFFVDSSSRIGHIHEFINNKWINHDNGGITHRSQAPKDHGGEHGDSNRFNGTGDDSETQLGLQFGIGIGGDNDHLREGAGPT